VANPYLRRSANNKTGHGRKAEKRLAREHGARLTPGSGAFSGHKSDMTREGAGVKLQIEVKTTNNDSIGIKLKWLDKITQEAKGTNSLPILMVSFVTDNGAARPNGDWVMMPKALFDLLDGLE